MPTTTPPSTTIPKVKVGMSAKRLVGGGVGPHGVGPHHPHIEGLQLLVPISPVVRYSPSRLRVDCMAVRLSSLAFSRFLNFGEGFLILDA